MTNYIDLTKLFIRSLRINKHNSINPFMHFKEGKIIMLNELSKDEKSVMHLYLKEQPLNQPTRYLDTASDEMRDYLRKGSKPFVIDDKEGKQWIVSTHMGDYSEAYWGPVGVDVTPLEHLK